MSVKIKISPVFYQYTNGQKIAEVHGSTVGQCLDHLVTRFPGIKKQLFSKNGKLFEYIMISVNGESTYPDGLKKPVNDGDTLSIMFIVGGG